ncbi:MAG: hypothetical protein R3C05_05995 [Pirellulaceae bacterium]
MAFAAGGLYWRGLIDLLVKHGADPNQIGKRDRWRPLHQAVKIGADKSLAELLECGADPTLAAPNRKAPTVRDSRRWSMHEN